MRTLSSVDIANKWADKTAAATDLMKKGVQGVKENPATKAVAQAQLWIDNLNKAFREGIWQRALEGVTLQDWQRAMIEKGIPVIADRVRKAMPKYQAFIEAYLSWYESTVVPQLNAMPRGSLEQNISRATLVIRESASMRGQFKKGRFAR